METDTRDAISIRLKRTIATGRPEVEEKIDTEMGVYRLLPDRVLWKKQCPNPETKPHSVTTISNNTSSKHSNIKINFNFTFY